MLAKRHDLRFGTCIDYFRFELDLTRFCNQFTCNVMKVFYLPQVVNHAAVDVYVIDHRQKRFVIRGSPDKLTNAGKVFYHIHSSLCLDCS